MKGFYIEVTNNLLERKHREAMGESVWLFMFFLDRMTSIDESGIGKVLGGKPIKFGEVEKDLGISERTYTRWIAVLKKFGYLNVRRTPYGLVISVNKAKKQFNRYAKSGVSDGRDTPKVAGKIRQTGGNKEDNTVDNTINTTAAAAAKEIAEIIFLFKAVNPMIQKLYGQPPQRRAVERLLKEFGREKLESMIAALPKINSQQYWPKSTTPVQLENNLGIYMAKKSELFAPQKSSGIKVAVFHD